jgi:hypothetical protein
MKSVQYIDPKIKLVDGVADWLCGENGWAGLVEDLPSGSKSLAHVLVVVPTAQSGRRLRFALAKRASEKGWGGVLPPVVAMTSALLNEGRPDVATEAIEIATLAEVLLDADLSEFPILFPRPPEERGLRWALDLA